MFFAVVLLATVSVAAAVAVVRRRSHPSTSPSVFDRRTGAILAYGYDPLRLIELMEADTGHVRRLSLPAHVASHTLASTTGELLRIDNDLLVNQDDWAWLYRPDDRSVVDLGPSLRISSFSENEVWLWDPADIGRIRLVALSGRQITTALLPTVWFPTDAATVDGIVLEGMIGSKNAEVWDPLRNQVVLGMVNATFVAAGGDFVAWESAGCVHYCTLYVSDLRIRRTHHVELPPQAEGGSGGSFSPDGRTLAVNVPLEGDGRGAARTGVVLVDTDQWTATLLAGSEQEVSAYGAFTPTWSKSGRLFFFAYGSGRVLAWQPKRTNAAFLPKAFLPALHLTDAPTSGLPYLAAL